MLQGVFTFCTKKYRLMLVFLNYYYLFGAVNSINTLINQIMIHEVTMYAAYCDNCGKSWEDTHSGFVALNCKEGMRDNLTDSEWHVTDDDKCYCRDCYTIDDDDNLIVIERKLNESN